jgi:hypothetical protein
MISTIFSKYFESKLLSKIRSVSGYTVLILGDDFGLKDEEKMVDIMGSD